MDKKTLLNLSFVLVFLLALSNEAFAAASSHQGQIILLTSPVTTTNTTSKTLNPVTSVIQNSTELPASRSATTTTKTIKAVVGIESFFSDSSQLYAVPLSYSVTPDFYLNLTPTIMSVKNENETKESGFGDMALSAKYRLGDEEFIESHTLLTIKFPTGDSNKYLGSGSYDLSATEKIIKKIDKFRFTLMGGITQSLNEAKVGGYNVVYGTQMSYMAAAETNLIMPNLWFGTKLSGVNNLNNTVDKVMINDDMTTLDVTPEIRYFTKYDTAIALSLIIPAYTRYEVTGAKDRNVVVNFGVQRAF